ncbi:MAG: flagellar biosynthesis protein FlhA [Gammaproteobacteria bacterium]|nr:flagellar biosynthesis protein FlhA [Gammaproteobacteria bacterium]MDH5729792.1 flagellar biosynthesis protein FlhA [Gammaproteobacteria bacterium]
MDNIKKLFSNQSDLILVLSVVGILLILFIPIPPGLLDFFIIANFSFALMLLLLTFYVDKPLSFSTFPSLLLIVTLFRLALNISATRLILSDADAGQVIDAVGSHVVAGNYIIGLIVFIVLIVVQYVVVTNGAQRVAEVAARFTLDSMPGKQMAIDADMNAGLIDEAEARQRRKKIEQEGNFYGAMDGASKFVKGDAIAGIIIIIIDIIGGLAIGIAQRGMEWGDALQTYTLLTVGDGIVTQIPALIIATGTGIIVTRAGSDDFLSKEITSQITAYPKTLLLIAFGLFIMMLLPGIPLLPVVVILSFVLLIAFFAYRKKQRLQADAPVESATEDDENIYELLSVDPIEVVVGEKLITLVSSEDNIFMDRIAAFRKQYAIEMGFVIPKIRFRDDRKFSGNAYKISMHGAKIAEGQIYPQQYLAINPGDAQQALEGLETKDPTYGLPAIWISEQQYTQASKQGYTLVDAETVLMTHLTELLKRQTADLLTRAETERLISRVRQSDTGLVDELVPNILTLSEVQKVLQSLLAEKVPINNIGRILETLTDYAKHTKSTEFLTEKVRHVLAPVICNNLADDSGELHVLTLDPSVEQSIAAGIRRDDNSTSLILDPKFTEQVIARLAGQVEKMMSNNHMPVLLCAPELRRQIKQLTERVLPHLSCVSLSEVPNTVNLKSFGLVTV